MNQTTETLRQRGAIRVTRERLSDGSHVIDVQLTACSHVITWHCPDGSTAFDLADALERSPSVAIDDLKL